MNEVEVKIKLRVGEGSDRLLLMPYKSKELVFLSVSFQEEKGDTCK